MTKRRHTYLEGWKMYPLCAAGHHLQGILVSCAIFSGVMPKMLAGLLWAILYIAYQGLSVIRKKDSAGLDVSDFMVGFGLASIFLIW